MADNFEKDVASIAKIDAVAKILEVICRTTGLGFSAVARVTESRWIACAVRDEIAFGLQPGGELEVQTTICDAIRQTGDAVVIDHVAADDLYRDHHTPKKYGLQSYISFPINLPDGRFFGTLCAIDPRPAKLNTPQILGMFKLFADLIALQLDAQDRMAANEAALMNAQQTAQLRDQFIAVLGHDLRNPLGAINSGVEVLRLSPHDEEDNEMLDMIRRSAKRMGGLIDNVLDFARGRLGGGLALSRTPDPKLEAALKQIVIELQTAWSSRTIHRDIKISQTVSCDSARIGQMLSNLLANALTHGDPAGPIRVCAQTNDDVFELSVTNNGDTIPPDIIKRLFLPFQRGSARPGQQGLGLGLYIAEEIARAHQGTLEVVSENRQTRFTFRMPLHLSD